MELTHLDIRTALRGAAFPSYGDDLERVARTNQADPEVLDALDHLRADDEYASVEEVLDELNLDHTLMEDTTALRVALGMEDDEAMPA
jgi:hypothetical protein